ncbi:EPIDERMAL PATTERNING FACTOR-like protein 4 [Mangifera indica]|uniref:EPIDERMAL PATTERNING FACTOR-like protein 4 n=1 Tax=Mangifera indica TaxID=29780 RepID=UPI001CFC28ED|nr:EPIDERMAL PATTERNING FACTOR-like protein 4 [Mangifera indica]
MRRHRHDHQRCLLSSLTVFTFLFFLLTQLGSGLQERGSDSETMEGGVKAQKRLSGPGSSPPTCRSKCGNCSPCSPVHVPIQPGFITPLEYYPEAWRCKCGNNLFMP